MRAKAVIYARVSSILAQDPEHQLVPLREMAKTHDGGLEIVGEFVDRVSGTTPTEKRKALDALVKEARQKKFAVVLIYALDRLGRDLRHLLNLLHELDGLGVTVVSMREQLNFGNPMGRACIALIGILSQLEREWISQRIRTALAVKKLTAKQTGSGWRCGRPSVGNPEIVAEVIRLRGDGLSIRTIEKRLGRRISRTTVARILKEAGQSTQRQTNPSKSRGSG